MFKTKQIQSLPLNAHELDCDSFGEIKNAAYEIYDGGSFWGLIMNTKAGCYRINKILQRYQPGTPFEVGGALFKLPKNSVKSRAVKNALKGLLKRKEA